MKKAVIYDDYFSALCWCYPLTKTFAKSCDHIHQSVICSTNSNTSFVFSIIPRNNSFGKPSLDANTATIHQSGWPQSQGLDKSTMWPRSFLQVRPFGQAVIPELSHGCIQYAIAWMAINKGQGFWITPFGAPSLPVPPASEGQYYSAPRPKEWLHCDGSRMQPSSEPTLQPSMLYLNRDTIIWSQLYMPLLSAASTVRHPW